MGYFIHDPLDSVSAPAALGAAAEVVIDLTHPRPLRSPRKSGPKLMVTKHIARADDHELVLADISGQGRNEEESKRGHQSIPPRVLRTPFGTYRRGVLAVSCLLASRIFRLLRRQRADRMAEPVGSCGHL